MQIDFQQILDVIKIIIPWLSGGLAGAILTYFLNRRLIKKNQPALIVKTSTVNYALPTYQKAFTNLKVSYHGRSYDQLSYHEINIDNISERAVDKAPFIISFPKAAQILDQNIISEPIRHTVIENQIDLESNQYRYILEDLHPGDSCKIQLMVQNGDSLSWLFRGSDTVKVTSPYGQSGRLLTDEFGLIILGIATYVMLGSLFFIGDILRGALIVFMAPYLYRQFSQWRAELFQSKPSIVYGPIVMSDSGSVKLAYDPDTGTSSVNAHFSKTQHRTKIKTTQTK
jgi:hypothetical protein